jgi:hypothetical protein
VSAIAFALVLFGIAVNVPFVFDHPETHVLNVSRGTGRLRRPLVARCRRCRVLTRDWWQLANGDRVCAKCVTDALPR